MNQNDLQAGDIVYRHDGTSTIILSVDSERAYIARVHSSDHYGSYVLGVEPLYWGGVWFIVRMGIKVWHNEARDLAEHPDHARTLDPGLVSRIGALVADVEIDLNEPLPAEDP